MKEGATQPGLFTLKMPDKGKLQHEQVTEAQPPNDIKHQAEEFVSSSSAHGLKMIFEKQNSVFRRALWAIYFLLAVVALGYFLYSTYVDVTRYPFKTVTSINMTSPLIFPAITVCNTNPMDLTKLSSDKNQAFQVWIRDNISGGNSTSSDADSNANGTINFTSFSVSQMTSEETFSATKVTVGEFFSLCVYDDIPVNCSHIFSSFQITFDSCFVLDPNRLPPATRRTSLTLTLFTNQAGYITSTITSGVKFHVHMPSETPDMMVSRHVASPGFYTNVAIKVSESMFLPLPYKAFGDSACVDTQTEEFQQQMDGDPGLYPGSRRTQYSLDACIAARSKEQASEICNCTSVDELLESYRMCLLDDLMDCYIRHLGKIMDQAFVSDFLGCPRPCHSYQYHTTISSSFFPSPQAENSLRQQGLFRPDVTDIRQNYLQLNFHYEDLTIHKTAHVPEYEWNTVMGVLGGNMGFFLGASVLTLTELLDFILCLWIAVCKRLWSSMKDTRTICLFRKRRVHQAWA